MNHDQQSMSIPGAERRGPVPPTDDGPSSPWLLRWWLLVVVAVVAGSIGCGVAWVAC